jgi:type IV pilus assembly protein PilF
MKNSNPSDFLKQTLINKTASKAENEASGDFDIIDVVPIPMHGDRMVRLRTLEEALNDFDPTGETKTDSAGAPVMGYFVQVKPRVAKPAAPAEKALDPELPATPAAKAAAPAAPINAGPSVQNVMAQATMTHSAVETSLPTERAQPTVADSIYLSDGKLNIPYLLQSADVLYSSGDYTLARNIYKAIGSSGDKTSVALMGMARCYEAEGKLEEARINYEESIAYHPTPEAYKALTALLIRQKKDQQAAEVIERALHHRQLEAATRYELHKTAGNCWGRLGNLKEAERHYRKALEVMPDADEIRTNLGAIHLQANRIPEAERHFNDALASNPKSHQALCGLGSCALAEGNKFAAHAWFARSLQIELKNPTAIFHLVKCAYEIKNYGVAAKILEEYIQVAPINIHLLYSLAGLQFHLGRASDARQTCIRIQQLNPEHLGARDLLRRLEEGFHQDPA